MTLLAPTLLLHLFATNNKAGQLVELAVRDTEISGYDFALISAIGQHGPLTPTDLSRRLGLFLTTTLFRVGKLEERDYVRRASNPEDGRSFLLSLTPSGLAQWEAASRQFTRALTRLELRLDDPEAVQSSILVLAAALEEEVAATEAASTD